MSTFLWESIAFGPIHSRRLGQSLGINLMPVDEKICTFNCLYCECGWTLEKNLHARAPHPLEVVMEAIERKLDDCSKKNIPVDSITFSGNGEPTLYPWFSEVIRQLRVLRDRYYPNAVITCLSNATQLYRPDIVEALKSIENPMLKLDAGTQEMLDIINAPIVPIDIEQVTDQLCTFNGNLVIQTMFLSGEQDGRSFDNSIDPEWSQWLARIRRIRPKRIVIYSLDRETPALSLHKFDKDYLETIAEKLRTEGFHTEAY
jgi:wyosine [tRNA(Phe)-imidazoG37] synthetase (radical SAM superfamily)